MYMKYFHTTCNTKTYVKTFNRKHYKTNLESTILSAKKSKNEACFCLQ